MFHINRKLLGAGFRFRKDGRLLLRRDFFQQHFQDFSPGFLRAVSGFGKHFALWNRVVRTIWKPPSSDIVEPTYSFNLLVRNGLQSFDAGKQVNKYLYIDDNIPFQPVDMVLFIFGHLNATVCQVTMITKHLLAGCLGWTLNLTTLIRYIFVFWIKSPVSLDDSFFAVFLNLTNVLLHFLFNVSLAFTRDKISINNYICAGIKSQLKTSDMHSKNALNRTASKLHKDFQPIIDIDENG